MPDFGRVWRPMTNSSFSSARRTRLSSGDESPEPPMFFFASRPRRIFLAALLASGVTGGAFAANVPAPGSDAQVTDFTLRNGMEVVVIPDHRAPIVTHMVW